ncbi:hypothetical protein ACJJTC_011164 [Scirpophaga incertulas]
MSCGKRPLVKGWEKSKKIPVIVPSRYEKNEASVKQHWKNVVKELEMSYKDSKFWESQSESVRQLVGPVIYRRIAKIFNLPLENAEYEPLSDKSTILDSDTYFRAQATSHEIRLDSISTFDVSSGSKDDVHDEQSGLWTITSSGVSESVNKSKSATKSKSLALSKTGVTKSFHRTASNKQMRSKLEVKSFSTDESAKSDDDLLVHAMSRDLNKRSNYPKLKQNRNPHYTMLYCSKSESDMIKWNSKYKQKTFEVSASDEFSKKAEIMTKKISKEFFDWWVELGNVEFKSEIKRPEDIEDLFQVWFNEHASQSLVLDPKILPCVLKSIANYVAVHKASCANVLKRQIAYDIQAETSPAHTTAFSSSLPQKMKHIPPKNNTEELWNCVRIPEDLRSMALVWKDIDHLTSTKAFTEWLQQRPYLPMPPCLKTDDATVEKKRLFVVPSDYIGLTTDKSTSSVQDLAIPVSKITIELKDVISKLMN